MGLVNLYAATTINRGGFGSIAVKIMQPVSSIIFRIFRIQSGDREKLVNDGTVF